MSTHERTRPQLGFPSAGSWLRLVPTGSELLEASGAEAPEVLGPDGTPVVSGPADTAERCARHADELAGAVEAALRALCEQLDALTVEPAAEARERVARLTWGQGSTLRAVAAALGELHTVLDELAHELTGPAGGAS
jgi:hypothetical protein